MKHKRNEVSVLTFFVIFALGCDFLILLSILLWWWIHQSYPSDAAWTWMGAVFGGELLITAGINVAGKIRDWKVGDKNDTSV